MDDIIKYDLLRMERDRLLRDSDFYFVSDYPHKSEVIKNQWIIYRQSLRDLPSNINISELTVDLENENLFSGITWPQPPQ
jgi:hypothetical protein